MRAVVVLVLLVVVATAQDIFVDPDYVSSVEDSTDDPFVGPTGVKDVTEDFDDYQRPKEDVETDLEEPGMEDEEQEEMVRVPDVPDEEEDSFETDDDFEEPDMVDEEDEPKEGEKESVEPSEEGEEPEVTTELPKERKSWPFRPLRPFSFRNWPGFGDHPWRTHGLWGGRSRGLFGGFGMDLDDLFRPRFGRFGRRGSHRGEGGKVTQVGNGIGCTVCKVVVKVISYEVQTVNATIERIEEVIKSLCELYPTEAAKETCDRIVDEIDQVVQLIEKDAAPAQICQELKLCMTSSPRINPHHMRRLYSPRKCGAMCNHLKLVNGIGFDVQMEKLETAREMISGFCTENKISTKCKYILHLMNKTEAELELIFAEENEAYCECDKRAPWSFFIHGSRGNSMCETCKKFEKGMIKDLDEAHQTVTMLLDEMNEICSAFPDPIKGKCTTIAAEIKAFTEYLENKLNPSGVCVAMGVCHKHKDKPVMKKFEDRISGILKPGGIFDILSPWGVDSDRRSPHKNATECLFCKDCLKELTPDAESKGKDFVKKSLSMVCESKSNGTDVSTVCKKMVDGVETVHKIPEKLATFRMPRLCELLDIC